MFKVIALIVLAVATVSSISAVPFNDPFIVETTGGILRGERLSCGLFCNYFSFKGITYGKNPTGDLRFRAPVPHEGWEGVREANEHTVVCPQSGLFGNNPDDEECLSLNVYPPNFNGCRAVMVWIYGGSFNGGSGNSLIYGPDFIVPQDVLILTLNYKVGPLGFLSTGDDNATGNYGMKDVILSLKWVQENIAQFGGDPDSVTIFGESAGDAAVNYLTLSPAAKGLFHKAISQSGSALNPWAYQPNPEKPIPLGHSAIPFVPSRDPANVIPDESFLPGEPIDIMNACTFNHMPYITGFNDGESLFNILEEILDPNVFNVYNANPQIMVPLQWNVTRDSPESESITQSIQRFYFDESPLSTAVRFEYTKFNTDLMFARGVDMTANIHAKNQDEPVYYYKFSFSGTLNLVKTLLLLTNYPGAVLADDVCYLFQITSIPMPLPPSNPAAVTRRLMVRMWTNFAKTGNPTPPNDAIANIPWNLVEGNQQYFEIGNTVFASANPHADRMEFWNEMKAKLD